MACTLAESPSDPFHRKLRQLRCLHCRFNCYRVERTSSRAGVAPAEVQRLSRRTFSQTTPDLSLASRQLLVFLVVALYTLDPLIGIPMRKLAFSLLVWVAWGLFAAPVGLASAQTITTLINFNQSNGSGPQAPLIQGFDGVIYGTTYWGGPNDECGSIGGGCGTVFSLQSTGLYNFCNISGCTDGSLVGGGLVQATNGLFYGTTQGGGHPNNECRAQFGCGTVFSITAQGVLRTLHAFNRSDGEAPVASLLQASNGNLYGITQGDVDNFKQPLYGSIFEITLTGSFTNLYTFCSLPNCVDGAYPQGSLIQAPNGNFYGTTGGGGAHSGGTL